jgi:hypothetical protein
LLIELNVLRSSKLNQALLGDVLTLHLLNNILDGKG